MRSLRILLAVLGLGPALLAAPSLSRPAPGLEGSAGLQVYSIGLGNLDVYRHGLGAEFQARGWFSESFGWAAALGAARWEADSGSRHWSESGVRGSLRLVPVGGSLLARRAPGPSVRYVAEAGLRYAWMDSSLRLVLEDGRRPAVSVDDAVFGLLGLEREQSAGAWTWFAGLAYQHELYDSKARWAEGRLRNNTLESLTLRAGVRF